MRKLIFLFGAFAAITFIACHSKNEKVKEKDVPASNSTVEIDDSISKKAGVNSLASRDSLKQYQAMYSQYDGRYQINNIKGSKTAIFNYSRGNKIKFELFTCTSYLNSESADGELTMTSLNNGFYKEPKRYRLDFIFSDSVVIVTEKRDSAYKMHMDLTFNGVYDKLISKSH